jgi:hypothetical protein
MPSETITLSADADRGQLPARASCEIQPVVIIFGSKPRHPRQKRAKQPRKPSAATSRKTFAFVNVSRPGKADEGSRRLVKTHAMQDVLRRQAGVYSKLEVKAWQGLYLSQDSPRFVEISPRAPPSCFLDFPIRTEPYMLELVHDCA